MIVPAALMRNIPLMTTEYDVPVAAVEMLPVAPAAALKLPPIAAPVVCVVASKPKACHAADVKVAVPAPTILNPKLPDEADILDKFREHSK
jgi:hypothetical protein